MTPPLPRDPRLPKVDLEQAEQMLETLRGLHLQVGDMPAATLATAELNDAELSDADQPGLTPTDPVAQQAVLFAAEHEILQAVLQNSPLPTWQDLGISAPAEQGAGPAADTAVQEAVQPENMGVTTPAAIQEDSYGA